MKKKILVKTIIFILLTTSICVFTPSVKGQGNAGTITSKAFQGNITIDGKYDDSDWNGINPKSYTLFEFQDPTTEQEIEVSSIHNNSILFVWVSVDETANEFGYIFLVFQSTIGPIVILPAVPSWSDGNDLKRVETDNTTRDSFMSSNTEAYDESYGGTDDFEGKCYTRSGGFDFEVAIPLDSGDTSGGDISLVEGDSIYMFPIIYFGSETYSLINTTGDGVWEQITLEIEEYSYWKIPSYSIPILLFSILAVSSFLIFKNRSKN